MAGDGYDGTDDEHAAMRATATTRSRAALRGASATTRAATGATTTTIDAADTGSDSATAHIIAS